MGTFLICLIISVLLSFGMSVALVNKGREWPIRKYNIIIRRWLQKNIHRKSHRVLKCSTCTSFWMAFISDLAVCGVCFLTTGSFFFFWPFSGFIAVGFTYFIFEFLTSVDNDIIINS